MAPVAPVPDIVVPVAGLPDVVTPVAPAPALAAPVPTAVPPVPDCVAPVPDPLPKAVAVDALAAASDPGLEAELVLAPAGAFAAAMLAGVTTLPLVAGELRKALASGVWTLPSALLRLTRWPAGRKPTEVGGVMTMPI